MQSDLSKLNGLFVGQLDSEELEAFNRACHEGWARRIYRGAAGLMGLAKVQIDYDRETMPR